VYKLKTSTYMKKKEYIMPKVALDSLEGESLLTISALIDGNTGITDGGNASDNNVNSADSKINTFDLWSDED